MKCIEAVNDFVIKFANVNGSGSASANELFAKAIMRMGCRRAAQHLPEQHSGPADVVRGSCLRKGLLRAARWRRHDGGDEPQTWDADLAEIEPGGYLFYDSTRPLPASKLRSDVQVIGVPLTEITNATYTDPRQRQLFKNIIYVGALSVLLDVDAAVFEKLFAEQYKGKGAPARFQREGAAPRARLRARALGRAARHPR